MAGGDKVPRKRGIGLVQADLLIINKVDLAPFVGADLEVMARDSRLVRGERPFLFTDCRHGVGIDAVLARLDAARAAHAAEDGRSPARAGWSTDTHGHHHAADGSHRHP